MKAFIGIFALVCVFVFGFKVDETTCLYKGNEDYISCQGRVEKKSNDTIALISAASSVSFTFTGNTCSVYLKSEDAFEHHNYVALVVDGDYIGRLKIEKGASKAYTIPIVANKKTHHLSIFKATEAVTGTILFSGTTAEIIKAKKKKTNKKRIEFIGNSITCGYGNDTSEVPCDTGVWYDQHNAYWAYGPILSRNLGVDFQLNAVSGIGMYRNWNDEHEEEPIMPEVYGNLYLNKNNSIPYKYDFHPDIISICLGTNDLSDGDGVKPRLAFNQEKFVNNYIQFIKMLYQHNPDSQVVLLSSPMLSGERNTILINSLHQVLAAFENDTKHKKIQLFEYQSIHPKGCGYHPDIKDHQQMAAQLEPFFKALLAAN